MFDSIIIITNITINITTIIITTIEIIIMKTTSATVFPCFALTPMDLWLGSSSRNNMRASTRT